MKDWLSSETNRNRRNARLFALALRLAYGKDQEISIAHHMTYGKDVEQEEEVPSADTLLFNHDFMELLFGFNAQHVMDELCRVRHEDRDAKFASYLADANYRVMGLNGEKVTYVPFVPAAPVPAAPVTLPEALGD